MTKGVEFGGVLAGKFCDSYEVTYLIVSDGRTRQVRDRGLTTNLSLQKSNLILLRLIHTHPNMDSFLSSFYLHALYDFANENHRIISLVLLPQKKTCPAFVLTEQG